MSSPSKYRSKRQNWRKKLVRKRLPTTKWMQEYNSEKAIADLIAGITVGLTVIPQALEYATLHSVESDRRASSDKTRYQLLRHTRMTPSVSSVQAEEGTQVYVQLKAIIVKLILAYPQHTLWMMISVMKSSYPQRIRRCQNVFAEPRLKQPHVLKLVCDFTQLAEKLIELCNKPNTDSSTTTTVSALVKTLPRLLAGENFSRIMMPFQEFCKVELPCKAARQERLESEVPAEPEVYIAGIEELVTVLPSLQKPRKVTLKGSDGKSYTIMLKPKDDLRRDYRLMEFNAVVNRFLRSTPATRRRRLYIRTYSVLPLNEECGLVEWVPRLVGLRPVLVRLYKQKGIHTSNRQLKELMCASSDPLEKKRRIFEEQLLPRHPPVFHEWFRRVFADPYGWYQARSAYVRTTAVMSMVGYILGLGDRHGENISFDSCNGDTVHVDLNCLFNKVRTKNKQLSLSLSPEGQVEHLIVEATSIHNLCQMYIGWGPFL